VLYHAYELQAAWLNSASAMASIGSELLTNPRNPMAYTGIGRSPAPRWRFSRTPRSGAASRNSTSKASP